MSKTIYIYIKKHNQTGLKYFGQTKRKDTHRYRGSGLYWKRHIKLYKYNVTTFVIRSFTNIQECEDFCIWFSKINNIVKSEKWANLMTENGRDGGCDAWLGKKHSEETKEKLRQLNLGKKLSEEHKRKVSENNARYWLGKKLPKETREKMSKAMMGEKNHMYGKIVSEETRKKLSIATSGENHPMYGKKHKEESKEKMRQAKLGKTFSEERKKQMSKERLGKILGPQKKVKCPHCEKEGGLSLMKRYHFDNCKNNSAI